MCDKHGINRSHPAMGVRVALAKTSPGVFVSSAPYKHLKCDTTFRTSLSLRDWCPLL